MPNSKFLAKVADTFCDDDSMTQFLCSNVLFLICGYNKDNLNSTLLPVILAHTPAGASTRQVLHYTQEVNSGMSSAFLIKSVTILPSNKFFPLRKHNPFSAALNI